MQSAHDQAKAAVALAFVATVIVDPLDAWLTESELKDVVTGYGIPPPVFNEIRYEILEERERSHRSQDDKLRPQSMDLMLLMMSGGTHYPPIFSMVAVERVEKAFSKLEALHGQNAGLTLELLLAECAGPPDENQRALGFLLTHGHVKRSGDRFIRTMNLGGSFGANDPNHPVIEKLARMANLVGNVVALRRGTSAPTSPPTQRFFLFMKKQGWEAFASWWALTTKELDAVADHAPTAATVLAGSLLEAALVAIAAPAKAAGEWRQNWLENDPTQWQLRDLIKQAEIAGTFTPTQSGQARQLADLRNRIHAGRFSTAGKPPFAPQYSDAHEAKLARLNLDALLARILEWAPIAVLTPPHRS